MLEKFKELKAREIDSQTLTRVMSHLNAPEVKESADRAGISMTFGPLGCSLLDCNGEEILDLRPGCNERRATGFIIDAIRLIELCEAHAGFSALEPRLTAIGWMYVDFECDLPDLGSTAIEVDRALDYAEGYEAMDYNLYACYPFSLAGLRQLRLDLSAEEVWRKLWVYFDAIDRLGWQIVKVSGGKFQLHTNRRCYERPLHPEQIEWLAKLIDSGDLRVR